MLGFCDPPEPNPHGNVGMRQRGRSVTGVSFKTLQLYALVFFFRLTSIIPFSGYLPYDK